MNKDISDSASNENIKILK